MKLSKLADGIRPYTAGEQPRDRRYIKLNTNENPYPPSPAVADALSGDFGDLRLYSDPESLALKTAIAKRYGKSPENVFVGNGSDEVLAMCFPAFFDREGGGAAFADVTYSFYPVWCDLFGVKKVVVPLKADFRADFDALADSAAQGIIIANPNAPTGIVEKKEAIERLAAGGERIVIVDEAYSDFSDESAAESEIYDNLLVVKTFSKSYSLAGARCGFALGDKKLIDALSRIKNSFNSYTVNTLTERVAVAAVNDAEYHEMTVKKIVATRERARRAFEELGFYALPSGANFLFVSHPKASAAELYKELKNRGVLVRHFDNPRVNDYLRITVGTDFEMDKTVEILSDLLK